LKLGAPKLTFQENLEKPPSFSPLSTLIPGLLIMPFINKLKENGL
jgi:hypothetical protein